MLGNGQLNQCGQRKVELLRRSAAHRDALLAEARKLRDVALWLDLGFGVALKARAGWSALAALRTVCRTTSDKPPGVVRRIGKALLVTRLLLTCWNSWRGSGRQGEGDSSEAATSVTMSNTRPSAPWRG